MAQAGSGTSGGGGGADALVLGFQHYFLTLGITVLIPSLIVPQMGGGDDEKARVIQTLLFVSGFSTLFPTLFGTRLPSVVVGSYAYVIPTTSILLASRNNMFIEPHERFRQTMRAIQGALIISGCFQMVMGFLGIWRNAMRFLSPLSVVPYVTFTGLGLYYLGFPTLVNCVEVGLPEIITMVFISQSTGTFFATARYGSATPVPPSVVSRVTGWLGLGVLFSGVFGCDWIYCISVMNLCLQRD
ncbi:hypothetical protein GH714_004376 [Hevea brasiliensis]|uniref:Uncharacterized protein n=1 Tax=Hevea brasiliensis TaxID=3981 RepID=A0A6A6MCF5_HEVBR|nr:hypothetical protein GH714_004376 [Hevea brasiliensis]